jgi:hypothetical protein
MCESHDDVVIFPNDQYAEVTIHSLNALAAVGVRHADVFTSGYLLVSVTNGDGTQNIQINTINGDGTFSGISASVPKPQAVGDVLRLEAIGTQITGFLNGVPVVAVSDATYATGTVSVDILDFSAIGDTQFSSFRAGSITAGHSISGSVGAGGAGATIRLSGTSSATTTADGSGNYSFTGLGPGTYIVTPGLVGKAFSASGATVTLVSSDVTGVNFITFTPSKVGSNSSNIVASRGGFATRIISPKTIIIGTNLQTGIRK